MISFLLPFLLIALSIACWLFVVVKRGTEFKKLVASGVETLATITVKTTVRMGKKRRPALTYEFTDPTGTAHKRRVFVTNAVYERFQEGGAVPVVYLPEKASVNALKWDVEDAKGALTKI
ncbi:MAG TPA: hypothetical protein VFX30_04150 [bacterium]|nr:hypothetical protein [bacterium]